MEIDELMKTLVKHIGIIGLVVLIASSTCIAQIPVLNQKMLKYAKRQVGEKVGKGVCWELVYQALKYSRAKMGDTVCYDSIQPGDIVYTGSTLLILNGYTQASELIDEISKGRDSVPNVVSLWSHPHIGIVGKVFPDGKFEMYEQNVQGSLRKSRVVCSDRDLFNWQYDSTTVLPIVYFERAFIRPTRGSAQRDLIHFGEYRSKLENFKSDIASKVDDFLALFSKGFYPSEPVLYPGDDDFLIYEDEMLADKCWIPSDLVYDLFYKDRLPEYQEDALDKMILQDEFVVGESDDTKEQ